MGLIRVGGAGGKDVESLNALDLAFAVDATGSMDRWFRQTRQVIQDVVDGVASAPSRPALRLGLTVYRDHGGGLLSRGDAPAESTGFVENADAFRRALKAVRCHGGGDFPEAVADGVDMALRLPWRLPAQKAIVLVGDAPPHGVGVRGDTYAKGCPCRMDVNSLARAGAARGIVLHAVAVTEDRYTQDAMRSAAKAGGGEFFTFTDAGRLATVLTEVVAVETGKVAADIAVITRYDEAGGDIGRIARSSGMAEVDVRESVERLRAKEAIAAIEEPGARVVEERRPSRVRRR